MIIYILIGIFVYVGLQLILGNRIENPLLAFIGASVCFILAIVSNPIMMGFIIYQYFKR